MPIELDAERARQGLTGTGLRWMLIFGLAGAVVGFAFALLVF